MQRCCHALFEQVHGRRLQQTAANLLDASLLNSTKAIATGSDNVGYLTEQQQTDLFSDYRNAFAAAGVPLTLLPCDGSQFDG
jgi:hypothetical protein